MFRTGCTAGFRQNPAGKGFERFRCRKVRHDGGTGLNATWVVCAGAGLAARTGGDEVTAIAPMVAVPGEQVGSEGAGDR